MYLHNYGRGGVWKQSGTMHPRQKSLFKGVHGGGGGWTPTTFEFPLMSYCTVLLYLKYPYSCHKLICYTCMYIYILCILTGNHVILNHKNCAPPSPSYKLVYALTLFDWPVCDRSFAFPDWLASLFKEKRFVSPNWWEFPARWSAHKLAIAPLVKGLFGVNGFNFTDLNFVSLSSQVVTLPLRVQLDHIQIIFKILESELSVPTWLSPAHPGMPPAIAQLRPARFQAALHSNSTGGVQLGLHMSCMHGALSASNLLPTIATLW